MRLAVLNVVGLTHALIGDATPRLAALRNASRAFTLTPAFPAVTATAQANYLTGKPPRRHGVVANGWYFRDTAEVRFWQQAAALVDVPRLHTQLPDGATVAHLFWWHALYAPADVVVTPRPMYPADGRKVPDVWTHPPDLRHTLQKRLGTFPLFRFWGPAADLTSTDWIARCAESVEHESRPTLSLVYLPHLDYVLQREGPRGPTVSRELAALDGVVGRLLDTYASRGVGVILLSEYGVADVDTPVFPNRILRDAGFLAVRDELGTERLDAGASRAFAVCDHQIAHVYVRESNDVGRVKTLLEGAPGVARVLDDAGKRDLLLDHPRSGELVVVAEHGCWCAYPFWLDDRRAPDYARTVDIHRKPGYDPCELFLDPARRTTKARLAAKLAMRKLGMRALLDVIPLDATLVRGSHGLSQGVPPDQGPLLLAGPGVRASHPADHLASTDVLALLRSAVA